MGRGGRTGTLEKSTGKTRARKEAPKKLSTAERRKQNQIWLNEYIEQHGPYLYHRTSLDRTESIEAKGLLSSKSSLDKNAYAVARPGCVYLASANRIPYLMGHPKNIIETRTYRVDIRDLDPGLFCPDEDYIQYIIDKEPNDYDNPYLTIKNRADYSEPRRRVVLREELRQKHSEDFVESVMAGIGQKINPDHQRPYENLGEWAEANDFGNRTHETKDSLERYNTISYQGEIPAASLQPVKTEFDLDLLYKQINNGKEGAEENLKTFKSLDLPFDPKTGDNVIRTELVGSKKKGPMISIDYSVPFIYGERVKAARDFCGFDWSIQILEEDGIKLDPPKLVTNFGGRPGEEKPDYLLVNKDTDYIFNRSSVIDVVVEEGRIKEITNFLEANQKMIEIEAKRISFENMEPASELND